MRLTELALVASLAFGLAGTAFAQDTPSGAKSMDSSNPASDAINDPQSRSTGGGPDPTDVGPLGIDIGAAGTTKESRMVFFRGLSAEQQTGVQSRCTDAINEGKREDIVAFCKDVMPSVGQ